MRNLGSAVSVYLRHLKSYGRFRWAQVGLLLTIPVAAAAQTATKDRQANDCYQAQAAYGNDQAACLVVLYKWEGDAARMRAMEYKARDRRLMDSLETVALRQQRIKERNDSIRLEREYRRADSIDQAQRVWENQFAASRKRREDSARAAAVAVERLRDSLDYAVGGNAKRQIRWIIEKQRDYYYLTNGFTSNVESLVLNYRPVAGITISLQTDRDKTWTGTTISTDGWRCTASGSKLELRPVEACEKVQ